MNKDVNEIVSGILEGILPNKGTSGNKPSSGDSPFEKLLAASFEQITANETGLQKELLSPVLPAAHLPVTPAPSGDSKFREALTAVLKYEGSAYVRKDGGKESSKLGILQSTAREYGYKGDIKNMSRADAETIYKKIWDESGAGSLPEPLSLVHFDTYVNSPAAARKLLQKSGGDPEVYLKMRAHRYTRLAQLRPARYGKYLKGWMNRIASLRNIANTYGAAKNLAVNEAKPSGTSEEKSS